MADPFLAGQRVTAGQLNEATRKTLKSVEVGTAGIIATTSGTTELNIPKLAVGPVDLVAGALYQWNIRQTLQYVTSGAQEYNYIIRKNTALTGTIISDWVIYNQVGTGGFLFTSWDQWTQATNESAVTFYVSVQRLNGSNTMNVYGQLSGTNRSGIALSRAGYSSDFSIVT